MVTSKDQVALPQAVRDARGLTAGSQLTLDVRDHQVPPRRVIPDENFTQWQGFLKRILSEGKIGDERLRKDRES